MVGEGGFAFWLVVFDIQGEEDGEFGFGDEVRIVIFVIIDGDGASSVALAGD